MPDWKQLLGEMTAIGGGPDILRRKYLRRLQKATGRNIITYYSGWLQKPELEKYGVDFSVNESDKNGFMAAVHRLDRSLGLDLVLHTPGGSIAATESIVDYLRKMFKMNIRAIVPQISMSAGTMIACSCKEILMGKHSSLGPIDPQFGGMAAHGIVEQFETAKREIKADPSTIPIWQALLSRYEPAMIGECQKAIKWSETMVKKWLESSMFANEKNPQAAAFKVIQEIGDHALTLSHDRRVSIDMARDAGLKVLAIEDDQKLQDAVLSVHHAYILTLTSTNAFKVIENHRGVAYINQVQPVMIPTR